MLRRLKWNGAPVVLTAIAIVAMMAVPAAADPVAHVGTVTAGTIEITDTDYEVDLSQEPEENPCELAWDPPEVNLNIDFEEDPAPTAVTGVDFSESTFQSSVNDEWYRLDISWPGFGSNGGAIDDGGSPEWDQDIFLLADIYGLGGDNDGPENCASTVVACQVGVQLALDGSFNAGPPAGGVLDSTNPTGDSVQINPTNCNDTVIEGQLTGERVIVSSMTVGLAEA